VALSGSDASTGTACELWAYRLLCASVFCVTFSLPAGRIFFASSLFALIAGLLRARRRPTFPIVAWLALTFSLLAIVVTLCGPSPEVGVGKLDKLLWFLSIPVAATLITSFRRFLGWSVAFLSGTLVLSLDVLLLRTIRALREAGRIDAQESFFQHLRDLGSMTDGQVLMLGLIASTCLICVRQAQQKRSGWVWGALILQLAAFAANLKRGSWGCALVVIGVFAACRLRLRVLAGLAIVVVLFLTLPPVWNRLAELGNELDSERGGRVTMWVRIAPVLIREHPWGLGWRSLTAERMQKIAADQGIHVEKGRNHLHSNPVQILVALGFLGLIIYLSWMVRSTLDGAVLFRSGLSAGPGGELLAALPVLMFVALLLNGLIEYNFADGELVLVYGMLMGIMGRRRLLVS